MSFNVILISFWHLWFLYGMFWKSTFKIRKIINSSTIRLCQVNSVTDSNETRSTAISILTRLFGATSVNQSSILVQNLINNLIFDIDLFLIFVNFVLNLVLHIRVLKSVLQFWRRIRFFFNLAKLGLSLNFGLPQSSPRFSRLLLWRRGSTKPFERVVNKRAHGT